MNQGYGRPPDIRAGTRLSGYVVPPTRAQCCDLWEIRDAPDSATAAAAMTVFADVYATKYAKAVDCPTKVREALLIFFNVPVEHWEYLRTSKLIESVFAAVRHRIVLTKGGRSYKTAQLMAFKLVMSAAETWRRLNGEIQLPVVIAGFKIAECVAGSATPIAAPPDQPRYLGPTVARIFVD